MTSITLAGAASGNTHLTLLLCAFGSIVCVAAPIDGKWTAQVQARQGTQTQTLTLKSSGATLTGSLDMGDGAFDIIEGKSPAPT